jgi:hypothetical protein
MLEEPRTIGANAFVVETRAAAVRAANFIVLGVGRGMKVVILKSGRGGMQ